MSAQFKLSIKLGNSEMLTGEDIAAALDTVSYQLASIGDQSPKGYSRVIHDVNGNTVGKWEVTR